MPPSALASRPALLKLATLRGMLSLRLVLTDLRQDPLGGDHFRSGSPPVTCVCRRRSEISAMPCSEPSCERTSSRAGPASAEAIGSEEFIGSAGLIKKVGSNTAPCPHDTAKPMGVSSKTAIERPFPASSACTYDLGHCAHNAAASGTPDLPGDEAAVCPKLTPNPLSPRRRRCAHCKSIFDDESHVVSCRECQKSLHSNCLCPHWAEQHPGSRFESSDAEVGLQRNKKNNAAAMNTSRQVNSDDDDMHTSLVPASWSEATVREAETLNKRSIGPGGKLKGVPQARGVPTQKSVLITTTTHFW